MHLFIPTLYLENSTEPPKRIATTRVRLSEPFAVTVGEDYETLNGLIEVRGNKFHANLRGNCEGTGNFFEGDLEPEKPVWATSLAFSGYAIMGFFVLSTNSDCKPFLESQPPDLDRENANRK